MRFETSVRKNNHGSFGLIYYYADTPNISIYCSIMTDDILSYEHISFLHGVAFSLTFDDRLHVTLGGVNVVQGDEELAWCEWRHRRAAFTWRTNTNNTVGSDVCVVQLDQWLSSMNNQKDLVTSIVLR